MICFVFILGGPWCHLTFTAYKGHLSEQDYVCDYSWDFSWWITFCAILLDTSMAEWFVLQLVVWDHSDIRLYVISTGICCVPSQESKPCHHPSPFGTTEKNPLIEFAEISLPIMLHCRFSCRRGAQTHFSLFLVKPSATITESWWNSWKWGLTAVCLAFWPVIVLPA